jgi:hypothetical protein
MRKSISDIVSEARQEQMMQDRKHFKARKPEYIKCRVCGVLVHRRTRRDTCTKHMDSPASIAALEME